MNFHMKIVDFREGNGLDLSLEPLPIFKAQKRKTQAKNSMPEWKICGADTETIDGKTFIVKDEGGAANASPVIILASGSNTIDGQNTIVLESPYASIQLYCNGIDKYYIC